MAQNDGQRLNQEAADWLARLHREEFSSAARAQLDRWLDADPAREVAFARAEYAWERAERLRAAPTAVQAPARGGRSWWRTAAVFAFVALGGVLGYQAWLANHYATGVGEQRTIALEDGSEISLNTDSRAEVSFNARQRTVRLLHGEALFKVEHDAARPFVVEAAGTAVRALGTAFNVRLRSEVVEVTVTEGAVAVDHDRIDAGSAAVVAAGAVSAVVLPEDVLRRRVAWREGAIELKGETLEQAVEEFNRYRKARLIVADPAIAAIRVGGRFETGEAAKFVNAVKENFPVRSVEQEDGTVYLFGIGAGAVADDSGTSQ